MLPTNIPVTPIRLVIVADVRLYCDGLAALLAREGLRVLGTASSRAEAAEAVRCLRPDVVLVDVALERALELVQQLHADAPGVQLIALAVGEDMSTIVACAGAGAAAYVPASAGVEELVTAIESAGRGELRCSTRVAGGLFRRAGDRFRSRSLTADARQGRVLTSRQDQVLSLLRQSLSNKEIAGALKISEATVKNHVHQLLDRLQVPNRVKAAAWLPGPGRASRRRVMPEFTVGPD